MSTLKYYKLKHCTLRHGFKFMHPNQVTVRELRKACDNHYLIVVHFCKNTRKAVLLSKWIKKLPSCFGSYVVIWSTYNSFSWFSKKFIKDMTSEDPSWFAPAGLDHGIIL